MTWFVGVEDDESGRKWSIDIQQSLMDDDDDDDDLSIATALDKAFGTISGQLVPA